MSREKRNQDITPGPQWQPELVVAAVRHPLSIRVLCEAPYLGELFRPDVYRRVLHPSQVEFEVASPTLIVKRAGRTWHIPGSADDLLLHVSCLIACMAQISRYLRPDRDRYDFTYPMRADFPRWAYGRYPLAWFYRWKMEQVFNAHLQADFTHVLHSDIERCNDSLDPVRICGTLRDIHAPPDAVDTMLRMHQSWRRTGGPGVPLMPGVPLLLKIQLKPMDDKLIDEGLTFVRFLDDFRVLCRGPEEAEASIALLSGGLNAVGLSMNMRKTRIVGVEEVRKFYRWAKFNLKITFRNGIGRPLLYLALSVPPLRPVALALLKLMYGNNVQISK